MKGTSVTGKDIEEAMAVGLAYIVLKKHLKKYGISPSDILKAMADVKEDEKD